MTEHEQWMFLNTAPNIRKNKPVVLAGTTAFIYSGLLIDQPTDLTIFTEIEAIKDVHIWGRVNYVYQKHVDMKYQLRKLDGTSCVFAPSPQRAIVECIMTDLAGIDEGDFLESLNWFTGRQESVDLIREAADHFGLDFSQVEYWINESIEYYSNF